MPRQFTPADRETVLEITQDLPQVNSAERLGPGITVIKNAEDSGQVNTHTGLMEQYGWFVAEWEYDPKGSRLKLMPVTNVEVTNDG